MQHAFTCIEGGVFKVKGTDLYILPYYKTTKADPNIQTLLSFDLEPSARTLILGEHSTGDILKIHLTTKTDAWLVCLSEAVTHFALQTVLLSVLREIEASSYKSIVIGQLALIEFGYENEEKWKRAQSAAMEDYAKKHPGVCLTMVMPGDDYRPHTGKHLGDGIIPEDDDTTSPDDIPESTTHHQVALPLKSIKSYCDYLVQYIDYRSRQYELINTCSGTSIECLDDLRKELQEYEGRNRLESFSKWSHKAPKKSGGVSYYPVPSKQKLKLIILILDMSYDEALACLNFFGYGLARFDREDIAFAYMIKTNEGAWKKPVDIRVADATLRKRFGAGAALIVKQNKKG